MQTTPSKPVRKYRPSLTLAEIQDCITALQSALPHSTALIQLQLYEARLRIREPEALPQGRQTSTLAASAVPKPQYPTELQSAYDRLYAVGLLSVFSGQMTEEQLDAELRMELTKSFPQYANLLQSD